LNTATIRYRVADFLSRHAPFQFVEQADLLSLAGSGRVRFHEKDEYIFRQGEPRKEYVSVIQQGMVDLHEETPTGTRLRDRLGEGELLGIGRFVYAKQYLYTAKTSGDVLLYRFPAAEFDRIVAKYPQVADYLSAYFSATPSRTEGTQGAWGIAPGDPVALRELSVRRLAVVDESTSLREIARILNTNHAEAVVVQDVLQKPIGLVTLRDVVQRIADGASSTQWATAAMDDEPPATAPPGLTASEYFVRLAQNRGRPLVLTADGRPGTPAVGLISANDLSLLAGLNPTLLAIESNYCDNAQQLSRLVQRSRAITLGALSDSSRAQWAAQMAGELCGAVVSRLIQLAEQEALDAGLQRPAVRSSWLFFGGAGRQELMTWFDVDIGLVFEHDAEVERADVDAWFARIAKRLDSSLQEAGFRFTESAVRVSNPDMRRSLAEWKKKFRQWVSQPTGGRLYESRSFFDFRCFHGDAALAEELRDGMFAAVAASPRFLALLAGSCLAQMPPLTFFKGLVVDDGGNQSDMLDLRRSAVFPLIDSARVFGLARATRQPGTFDRLTGAAELLPASRDTFEAAKEAYRVTLQQRGRAGLSAGDDGVHIRPASLSKYEQQVLKGAFRSILELLELTGEYFRAVVGR
jgi:CBS domain-containing protein